MKWSKAANVRAKEKGWMNRWDTRTVKHWAIVDAKLNLHSQHPTCPNAVYTGQEVGGDRKWERSTEADPGGILGAPDQTSASSWGGGGGRDSGAGGGLRPRPQPEGQTPAGPAQWEAPPAAGLRGACQRALRAGREEEKVQWSSRKRSRRSELKDRCGFRMMDCVCRAEKFITEGSFSFSLTSFDQYLPWPSSYAWSWPIMPEQNSLLQPKTTDTIPPFPFQSKVQTKNNPRSNKESITSQ